MTSRQLPSGFVLAGKSFAIACLRERIRVLVPHLRVASVAAEDGSNPISLARAIHDASASSEMPFVDYLRAEEDRFHEDADFAAALTGAAQGSLYLANPSGLNQAMQSTLLRLLQDRPGPLLPARVIAAAPEPGDGKLSAGLEEAFASVVLYLPSIEKRFDDLSELATILLGGVMTRGPQASCLLPDGGLDLLRQHRWTRGVDELAEILIVAFTTDGASGITCASLQTALKLASATSEIELKEAPADVLRLQDVMDTHILRVLSRCDGNKVRAAELLGISRSTLYRALEAIEKSHDGKSGAEC